MKRKALGRGDMSKLPIEHMLLHPVNETNIDSILFSHFHGAFIAFQKDDDSLAHDLIISVFDAMCLGLFYEYARQHQWSRECINAAEKLSNEQRAVRGWSLAREARELACGRHSYTATSAVYMLIQKTYVHTEEIFVESIIAGKSATQRLLPAPKPSQKRSP